MFTGWKRQTSHMKKISIAADNREYPLLCTIKGTDAAEIHSFKKYDTKRSIK